MSSLQNDFDRDLLKSWFIFNYKCFWCGQSHADAFHHILGRESNSLLNACPIGNFTCHIGNGKLSTDEVRALLLQRTYQYLDDAGYVMDDKDEEFYIRHRKLYLEDVGPLWPEQIKQKLI